MSWSLYAQRFTRKENGTVLIHTYIPTFCNSSILYRAPCIRFALLELIQYIRAKRRFSPGEPRIYSVEMMKQRLTVIFSEESPVKVVEGLHIKMSRSRAGNRVTVGCVKTSLCKRDLSHAWFHTHERR